MALFKDMRFLYSFHHPVFDTLKKPGDRALPGIYRCATCGRETVMREGDSLPIHLHENSWAMQWQLVVSICDT